LSSFETDNTRAVPKPTEQLKLNFTKGMLRIGKEWLDNKKRLQSSLRLKRTGDFKALRTDHISHFRPVCQSYNFVGQETKQM
jgi:hypothetical protein